MCKRSDVERIMNGMTCPVDFACTSEYKKLCAAREVGIIGKKMLVCEASREIASQCALADSYGGDPKNPHGYLCKCSMREKLAREMPKE